MLTEDGLYHSYIIGTRSAFVVTKVNRSYAMIKPRYGHYKKSTLSLV